MKVIEIAFVGYPVTDLPRARQFYEGMLGLKMTKLCGDEKAARMEYDIGANTLAIANGHPKWKPSPGGGTAALAVEDFAAAGKQLRESGCTFYADPVKTPVCNIAIVADPDGNPIMIHQREAG
jgi:predicted enzyme related to lactoylglutathione lyase